MDIINPSVHSRAVRQLWNTHHLICLFCLVTGLPLFWFTPFVSNSRALRDFAVVYGLCSSLNVLFISRSLSRDEMLIQAIEKQEQANLRHAIATSGYLAEQTDMAIAFSLLQARQESLEPVYEIEPIEQSETREFREVQDVPENSEVASPDRPSLHLVALVQSELSKGTNRSDIIKKYLKKQTGSYQAGKALLGRIELEATRGNSSES